MAAHSSPMTDFLTWTENSVSAASELSVKLILLSSDPQMQRNRSINRLSSIKKFPTEMLNFPGIILMIKGATWRTCSNCDICC